MTDLRDDVVAADLVEPVRVVGEVVMDEGDEVLAAPGRVLRGYRRRLVQVPLTGDYDGMWVRVWINAPRKLFSRLGDNDNKVAAKALAQFITDHNLVYDDGTPLPKPLTADAIDELDNVLISQIVKKGVEAMQRAAGVSPS